jgi:hypothetical protein
MKLSIFGKSFIKDFKYRKNQLKSMELNIFKNKKGSILDPILSSAYILKIAITIIIALIIWAGFNSTMTEILAGTDSEEVLSPVLATLTGAYGTFDYMFPVIVGGLMIISLIFAYKTGANYVLGIISFLFWIITVLLSTVFTNVYIAVTNEFPNVIIENPIMDAIMMNIRWVALAWIAAISAVMFRKDSKEDESSQLNGRAYGQ